jgi:hypothetical protein
VPTPPPTTRPGAGTSPTSAPPSLAHAPQYTSIGHLRVEKVRFGCKSKVVVLCYAVACWVVLCCAVLCYSVACWVVLCCVVLCYAVACWDVLCCTVLCYSVACWVVLCCAVLCYSVACWDVLCCTVLCYSVACWDVLCCAVLCRAVLCCDLLCMHVCKCVLKFLAQNLQLHALPIHLSVTRVLRRCYKSVTRVVQAIVCVCVCAYLVTRHDL